MKLSSIARGAAAVVAGLAITGIFGLATFLLAFLYFPIELCLGKRVPNPFSKAPKYWAYLTHKICTIGLLNVQLKIRGSRRLLLSPEPGIVLCIANHPSTLALASFTRFLTSQHLTGRLVVVAKSELSKPLQGPFIGWPLRLIGSGISIRRERPETAFASIRKGIEQLPKGPLILLIFPDQHRPTVKRIARDCVKYARKITGAHLWLRHTLVPRSGGLLEILQGLDQLGRPFSIINLTHGFAVRDESIADAAKVCDTTLWIDIEEIAPEKLPRSEAGLQRWLNEEWKRKNYRIALWRSNPDTITPAA